MCVVQIPLALHYSPEPQMKARESYPRLGGRCRLEDGDKICQIMHCKNCANPGRLIRADSERLPRTWILFQFESFHLTDSASLVGRVSRDGRAIHCYCYSYRRR
ncbi:hypothetical protein J6590_034675 [Homalodisca vitripennis]|nr:hypothetical protein J6590_034675 [Homalodisca vitripennis]